MKITAHIRKTDALHKPWYVQYSHCDTEGYEDSTDGYMIRDHWLHFKATGFDSYGAAHAHATAMGAQIVDEQASDPADWQPDELGLWFDPCYIE